VKERLTGAIILVTLFVLLVPELLTGPIRAKPATGESSTPAAAPVARLGQKALAKAPLRTYTLTLGAAPPDQADGATPASQVPPAQGSAQSSPERLPQRPAPSVKPAPRGAPENSAAATKSARQQAPLAARHSGLQVAKSPPHRSVRGDRSSGSSAGWVVQLGSFASHQNADRLARSLESRGFRVSVSSARAGARVLWRVRAGPVSDRTQAGRLAARLRALGHRGELLPLK
jgi:DedD protein